MSFLFRVFFPAMVLGVAGLLLVREPGGGESAASVVFAVLFIGGIALLGVPYVRRENRLKAERQEALQHYSEQQAALAVQGGAVPKGRRRNPLSERVKNEVWRRDQGRCVQCGSQERLEFDHIIPWSKGGSDTARNLQLLCERCNRAKSATI